MTNRMEVNENELENIVGGALVWEKGIVYPKDNPSAVYHWSDYEACTDYIKENWHGGAQTEETLIMLKNAGLVW